jgi:hypothetical protein
LMWGFCMPRVGKERQPWWGASGIWALSWRRVVFVQQYTWSGYPVDCHCSAVGAYPAGAGWQEVEKEVLEMLRKSEVRKSEDVPQARLLPCEWATLLPTTWAYLTQDRWEDGSPRETSGLLVFQQDGLLKAMLRDKNSGLCLWVTGQSLQGLLATLEAALGDPAAEWRQDRQQAGQKASRVNKRTG